MRYSMLKIHEDATIRVDELKLFAGALYIIKDKKDKYITSTFVPNKNEIDLKFITKDKYLSLLNEDE